MKSKLGIVALSSIMLAGLAGCMPTGVEVTADEWRDAFRNIECITIQLKGNAGEYIVEFENDNLSRITDTSTGSHNNYYYDENGTFGYKNTYWQISDSGSRISMLSMSRPTTESARSCITCFSSCYESSSFSGGRYHHEKDDYSGDATIVFAEDKSLLQVNTTNQILSNEYKMVATFEDVNLNITGFSA